MKNLKLFALAFVSFLCLGIMNVNAEDVNSIADAVAPDNKISFDSIVPTTNMEFDFYTNLIMMKKIESYDLNRIHVGLDNCNSTYTTCDLIVLEQGINDSLPINRESREVTVIWKSANQAVKTKVNSFIETLKGIQGTNEWGYNNQYYFDLSDMSLINYYLNSETSELNDNVINNTIAYSEQVRNMFKGINLTYAIDFRAGMSYSPFSTQAFGGLLFKYNNIVYGFDDGVGIKFKEIIYVPSDTELTDAALIAAANSRIQNYMPNSNITITAGNNLSTFKNEFEEPIDFSEIIDTSKTTTKSYNVNFGSFTVPFVIVADSSKMTNPKFSTKDIDTNVSVSSNDSSIPLDASIKASKLDKDSNEYKSLLKILSTNKMFSYDISLFSNVKNRNITQTSNGKFLVSIPVPTELEGKNLVVYYVNSNNEKEAHEVTIENKVAIFETDHFSTYSLVEKSAIENPSTLDSVTNYIIIGIISVIGILIISCYIHVNRKNKCNG